MTLTFMSLFSIIDCTTKITIEKMRQLLKLVNKQTRFSKRMQQDVFDKLKCQWTWPSYNVIKK